MLGSKQTGPVYVRPSLMLWPGLLISLEGEFPDLLPACSVAFTYLTRLGPAAPEAGDREPAAAASHTLSPAMWGGDGES